MSDVTVSGWTEGRLTVRFSYRMAAVVYTNDGKKISRRLWLETMIEFTFARVDELVYQVNQ